MPVHLRADSTMMRAHEDDGRNKWGTGRRIQAGVPARMSYIGLPLIHRILSKLALVNRACCLPALECAEH